MMTRLYEPGDYVCLMGGEELRYGTVVDDPDREPDEVSVIYVGDSQIYRVDPVFLDLVSRGESE
jgi:hypothetical protein